jgi:hypothetical protein
MADGPRCDERVVPLLVCQGISAGRDSGYGNHERLNGFHDPLLPVAFAWQLTRTL